MSERDPSQLADELEEQAGEMQERTESVGQDIADAKQEWERKRAAADVPGANPPTTEESGEDPSAAGDTSPAPEAPPEQEGPAAAEMASEGQAGPPADSGEDDSSDRRS